MLSREKVAKGFDCDIYGTLLLWAATIRCTKSWLLYVQMPLGIICFGWCCFRSMGFGRECT